MALERQYGFTEIESTIENLWTTEKSHAPVIVLAKEQVRLIFRGNGTIYNSGVPVAKPWQTQYRGEAFLYIPIRTKAVHLDIPNNDFSEKPILNTGIIGIANLRSIALVPNEKDWQDSFGMHKEIGSKPFSPTYLWFLQGINQFWFPNGCVLDGKWKYDEKVELENNILPVNERSLHFVSIQQFLYRS